MKKDSVVKVLQNFRTILRHMNTLPSNALLRTSVLEKFHTGKLATDPTEVKHLRALAAQYATMVSSIKELQYLRGLDSGEKLNARDKIKATASRVGLSVPEFADQKG